MTHRRNVVLISCSFPHILVSILTSATCNAYLSKVLRFSFYPRCAGAFVQAYALKVIQEKYEEGVRKQIVQEMQILRRSQCEHVSGLNLVSEVTVSFVRAHDYVM